MEELKIKETWFKLPNYNYEYSNLYNIRSLDRKHTRGKILKWTYKGKNQWVNLLVDKKWVYYSLKNLKDDVKNIHLTSILKHVETLSGDDIRTKKRDRKLVFLRVVFTKLALDNIKGITPEEIMTFLRLDRCSSYHYKKITQEVLKMLYYNEIYILYKGIYNEEDNKLKEEIKLTNNEKKYRLLSEVNKIEYNKRVSLFLKSLEWKQKKESEKYETINCS